jgi:hypothetical protein
MTQDRVSSESHRLSQMKISCIFSIFSVMNHVVGGLIFLAAMFGVLLLPFMLLYVIFHTMPELCVDLEFMYGFVPILTQVCYYLQKKNKSSLCMLSFIIEIRY